MKLKIKEMTLGMSYTHSPEPYHSVKSDCSVTVTVDEGDDQDELKEALTIEVLDGLLSNMGEVQAVHKLTKKGLSATQILRVAEDAEVEPTAMDVSWDELE